MKPRILLSGNTKMQYYADAVQACGGIPEGRYCPQVSDGYDGLILCGGNDICPMYYGEEIHGAVSLDTGRDRAEYALCQAFLAQKKPILGICRGVQMINVVLGGTLHQHLDCAGIHMAKDGLDSVHSIRTVPGTFLRVLYGELVSVNSAHHQAVKRLGAGLRVSAEADGTVEGFMHETLPIIGVQWHPERMCCSQKRTDTVDGAEVFRYFLALCREQF